MAVGRPRKKPSEILLEVPCKVPPVVAEAIEEMANSTDRSRSQITRKLILRGLAAFRRDGLLDEPEEAQPAFENAELLAAFGHLPIVDADTINESDAVIVANVGTVRKG